MSDSGSTERPCPSCGKLTDATLNFCRHCLGPTNRSAPAVLFPDLVPPEIVSRSRAFRRGWSATAIAFVVCLVVITLFMYMLCAIHP